MSLTTSFQELDGKNEVDWFRCRMVILLPEAQRISDFQYPNGAGKPGKQEWN
jgi:hypothetical protein